MTSVGKRYSFIYDNKIDVGPEPVFEMGDGSSELIASFLGSPTFLVLSDMFEMVDEDTESLFLCFWALEEKSGRIGKVTGIYHHELREV